MKIYTKRFFEVEHEFGCFKLADTYDTMNDAIRGIIHSDEQHRKYCEDYRIDYKPERLVIVECKWSKGNTDDGVLISSTLSRKCIADADETFALVESYRRNQK